MSQFAITTRIFFGKEGTREAQYALKNAGLNKLVFVVDKSIAGVVAVTRLISDFKEKGFSLVREEFFDASREPTYDLLDSFAEKFKGLEMDAIVAVGGGSVMDEAKGVAILLKNPGKGVDYRGMDKVKMPGVPVVCFPTTAGTGSEVTHTASFIDTQTMTKLGINGKYVAPLFGVLQPELTFSCPPRVTLYSGLDAMVHAIEAVTAKTATALTKMLGSKAFSLLYAHFRAALAQPENYEARENMLLGSYIAGMAMMNAGGGPASGISYPLGVHYNVPHGIAGGIFLSHVFEYNVSCGYAGYEEVYNLLPDADLYLSGKEKSADFVRRFKALYGALGAPETLSLYHVTKSDIEKLAQLIVEQRKGNLDSNPVPFGRGNVVELLRKVVE